jgi:hypothetical protein
MPQAAVPTAVPLVYRAASATCRSPSPEAAFEIAVLTCVTSSRRSAGRHHLWPGPDARAARLETQHHSPKSRKIQATGAIGGSHRTVKLWNLIGVLQHGPQRVAILETFGLYVMESAEPESQGPVGP